MTTIDLAVGGDAVVRDLPHDQYLAHPALSATGAKVIRRPGGPARYRHERDHGQLPRPAFDLGHAAHDAVLGVGPRIVIVDAADWRTTTARAERDVAYAAGAVPLLIADAQRVADMADALRGHAVAARLLHHATGEPEVSLFWHDPEHDVDRKGRVDFLRHPDDDGRLILVDYKTCTSADPEALARAVVSYGYDQQGAWYRDLVIGLGLARSAPFVFVFQETTAPYLVHCVELDAATLVMGADKNREALTVFARCTAEDRWPGYNDDGISLLSAPAWAHRQHEEAQTEQ